MRTFLLVLTTASYWISAFGVVAAARWNLADFSRFGADLPAPTLLTIDAARYHVPWLAALVVTVLLLYLRASPRFAAMCAVVSAAGMLAVAFATIAWVLPHYTLCGQFVLWPDWPWEQAAQSAPAKVACR